MLGCGAVFWGLKGLRLVVEQSSLETESKERLAERLESEQREHQKWKQCGYIEMSEGEHYKAPSSLDTQNSASNSKPISDESGGHIDLEISKSDPQISDAADWATNISDPNKQGFSRAIRLDRLRLPFGVSYFNYRRNIRKADPPKPSPAKKPKKEVFRIGPELRLDWVINGFGTLNKKSLAQKILSSSNKLKPSQIKDDLLGDWSQVYFSDFRKFVEYFGEQKALKYYFECLFGNRRRQLLGSVLKNANHSELEVRIWWMG